MTSAHTILNPPASSKDHEEESLEPTVSDDLGEGDPENPPENETHQAQAEAAVPEEKASPDHAALPPKATIVDITLPPQASQQPQPTSGNNADLRVPLLAAEKNAEKNSSDTTAEPKSASKQNSKRTGKQYMILCATTFTVAYAMDLGWGLVAKYAYGDDFLDNKKGAEYYGWLGAYMLSTGAAQLGSGLIANFFLSKAGLMRPWTRWDAFRALATGTFYQAHSEIGKCVTNTTGRIFARLGTVGIGSFIHAHGLTRLESWYKGNKSVPAVTPTEIKAQPPIANPRKFNIAGAVGDMMFEVATMAALPDSPAETVNPLINAFFSAAGNAGALAALEAPEQCRASNSK